MWFETLYDKTMYTFGLAEDNLCEQPELELRGFAGLCCVRMDVRCEPEQKVGKVMENHGTAPT